MSRDTNLFDHDEKDNWSGKKTPIRYRNVQAQGDFEFESKQIKRGGRLVNINQFTSNAVRVSKTAHRLFQLKFKDEFDYEKMSIEAEEKLLGFFLKHKLMPSEHDTNAEAAKKKRLRTVKIDNEVTGMVKDQIGRRSFVEIDFDVFMDQVNIKSSLDHKNSESSRGASHRFAASIDALRNAQSSSKCKYNYPLVIEDDETGELVMANADGESFLVPGIEFIIKKGDHGITTIEQLLKSRKHNKHELIDHVRLNFDVHTFSQLVALPRRDFTTAYLSDRDANISIYTFRLDLLIRSIANVQHIPKYNQFTLNMLNKKFSVSYKRYADFKRRILIPSCKEFNETYDDYYVSFEEIKKGNSVQHIRFIVRSRAEEIIGKPFVFDLSYYIATQHYYFNHYVVETHSDSFAEYRYYIQGFLNKNIDKNISLGGENTNDLSIADWEDQFAQAQETTALLNEVALEDPDWFLKRNIKFCNQRLCLVDIDTEEPYDPMPGLVKITSPIDSYKYYLIFNEKKVV